VQECLSCRVVEKEMNEKDPANDVHRNAAVTRRTQLLIYSAWVRE